MASSLHSPRYEQFRKLLIQKRKEQGLTQMAVAEALGKPQSYVSKYEKGERRLDVVEFIDIAKVIGFDASSFLVEFNED